MPTYTSDSLATKRDHMDEQTKLIEGFNITRRKKLTYFCSFTPINGQRGNEVKQWFLALAKVARKGRPIIHFKINIQVRSPAEQKDEGVSNSPDKILM